MCSICRGNSCNCKFCYVCNEQTEHCRDCQKCLCEVESICDCGYCTNDSCKFACKYLQTLVIPEMILSETQKMNVFLYMEEFIIYAIYHVNIKDIYMEHFYL
jgi:hypothetical protein